jgi:hypothetical protein
MKKYVKEKFYTEINENFKDIYHQIVYTYLLAMRTIASLLSPVIPTISRREERR